MHVLRLPSSAERAQQAPTSAARLLRRLPWNSVRSERFVAWLILRADGSCGAIPPAAAGCGFRCLLPFRLPPSNQDQRTRTSLRSDASKRKNCESNVCEAFSKRRTPGPRTKPETSIRRSPWVWASWKGDVQGSQPCLTLAAARVPVHPVVLPFETNRACLLISDAGLFRCLQTLVVVRTYAVRWTAMGERRSDLGTALHGRL